MTSAVAGRHCTFAEYLHVEELSREIKHELVFGAILAMAGGTVEHSALASAMVAMLVTHVRGGPCSAHGSDLRIRIREADAATYADASVICDPIERDPESPTHVTNPRVIVEVLSPSTEEWDREGKRELYQQLPSLQEYVLVSQDRQNVEIWSRDGTGWAHEAFGAGRHADCDRSTSSSTSASSTRLRACTYREA